jgi:hypothetical protein
MLFFRPKLNTVFASRWRALLWAAGILLTAYCTVPAADGMKHQLREKQEADQFAHRNPWALDPK